MRKIYVPLLLWCLVSAMVVAGEKVDLNVIAQIREEGFQRSQVMDIVSYITDVHGNRLTGSLGIQKAQKWAKAKMEEIGLENTVIEPILDHGVSWDNEYTSLHMLEPGYYPIQGFPLAYTPGTVGKITCQAVIADIKLKEDFEKYRGKFANKIVLLSPVLVIEPESPIVATRRTEEDLNSQVETIYCTIRSGPP